MKAVLTLTWAVAVMAAGYEGPAHARGIMLGDQAPAASYIPLAIPDTSDDYIVIDSSCRVFCSYDFCEVEDERQCKCVVDLNCKINFAFPPVAPGVPDAPAVVTSEPRTPPTVATSSVPDGETATGPSTYPAAFRPPTATSRSPGTERVTPFAPRPAKPSSTAAPEDPASSSAGALFPSASTSDAPDAPEEHSGMRSSANSATGIEPTLWGPGPCVVMMVMTALVW